MQGNWGNENRKTGGTRQNTSAQDEMLGEEYENCENKYEEI